MQEAIIAGGTVVQGFDKRKDAQAAVQRLRDAGFPDVRLSERSGTTRDDHVGETAGRTEVDFAKALREAGFPAEKVRRITKDVAAGAVLLTVVVGARTQDALAALRGDAVAERPLAPVEPAAATPRAARAPSQPETGETHPDDRVVPVREEQLEIQKRSTTSEARVRREAVTEEKTITVPVRREELVVERDGEAPMHIPVTGEEPRVERDSDA
jgi:stress response protein YsnF